MLKLETGALSLREWASFCEQVAHSLKRELCDRICCSVAVLQFEIRVYDGQIYSYIYIYKYRNFLWFVDGLKSNCNTATLQHFEKYGLSKP